MERLHGVPIIARYARDRTHHQPGSSGVLALINPPWGPLVRGLTDEPTRIHVDVCAPFGPCGEKMVNNIGCHEDVIHAHALALDITCTMNAERQD
jgi:hypothetical protein